MNEKRPIRAEGIAAKYRENREEFLSSIMTHCAADAPAFFENKLICGTIKARLVLVLHLTTRSRSIDARMTSEIVRWSRFSSAVSWSRFITSLDSLTL
jgi:hypothetical protein